MKHSFSIGLAMVLALAFIILVSSCRENFDYVPSSGNLQFSKDTVFLDTVFTNIGSATYTLKVYNPSEEDILIPYVGMETGQESSYRLNVDGLAGKEFEDVPLLAKDSLFVFIETTFDISKTAQNEFLYTEDLLFTSNDVTQKVPLVTLVKDAVFLYPPTRSDGTRETLILGQDEMGNDIEVPGFVLGFDQLNFTAEKPYVIYGYAAVPESGSLVMESGARVHFHQNSGMVVNAGANLQVNGQLSSDLELLENEVIFEGDRLEPTYANEPGQWGTIWIKSGSVGNQINHLTVKNATVGFRIEDGAPGITPTATFTNTQIYNSLNDNLWASAAYVVAENCVFGSAGNNSARLDSGGTHRFTHCTLANHWSSGFRNGPALLLSNEDSSNIAMDANFANCIIWGSASQEFQLQNASSSVFDFRFQNCLLQFQDGNNLFDGNPLYDFNDPDHYLDVIFNESPEFLQPFNDQLQIEPGSAAIDAAEPNIANPIPSDILGNDRTQNPDIGAYEFVMEN